MILRVSYAYTIDFYRQLSELLVLSAICPKWFKLSNSPVIRNPIAFVFYIIISKWKKIRAGDGTLTREILIAGQVISPLIYGSSMESYNNAKSQCTMHNILSYNSRLSVKNNNTFVFWEFTTYFTADVGKYLFINFLL